MDKTTTYEALFSRNLNEVVITRYLANKMPTWIATYPAKSTDEATAALKSNGYTVHADWIYVEGGMSTYVSKTAK